jgi:hypothetical protein
MTALLTQPLIGYRRWRGSPDGWLRPLSFWGALIGPLQPGPNAAFCVHGCSRRGRLLCTCGFYAWSSPPTERLAVQGVIAGWGRVTVHEHGWRAEKAQILALIDPNPDATGVWADKFGGHPLATAARRPVPGAVAAVGCGGVRVPTDRARHGRVGLGR